MLETTVIGNLGRDAEIKDINGQRYVTGSVAHSAGRDKPTTWVKFMLRIGERSTIQNLLKTGAKIFVRGDLQVGSFTMRDGSTAIDITVWANKIEVLQFAKEDQPEEDDGDMPDFLRGR